MRIIGGRFGGRKLVSFDEKHIRPTTDRVKESVFNMIGSDVEGARVLDLYSGTGSLGLEALSRGAQIIEFVDKNSKSLEVLIKNIGLLDVAEEVEVHRADVIRFLEKYQGDPFSLILIDPPFPARICQKTLETLFSSQAFSPDSVVMIEYSSHENLDLSCSPMERVDTRNYGDKLVAIFRKDHS